MHGGGASFPEVACEVPMSRLRGIVILVLSTAQDDDFEERISLEFGPSGVSSGDDRPVPSVVRSQLPRLRCPPHQ